MPLFLKENKTLKSQPFLISVIFMTLINRYRGQAGYFGMEYSTVCYNIQFYELPQLPPFEICRPSGGFSGLNYSIIQRSKMIFSQRRGGRKGFVRCLLFALRINRSTDQQINTST